MKLRRRNGTYDEFNALEKEWIANLSPKEQVAKLNRKFLVGGNSIEGIVNCIISDMDRNQIAHIYDLPKN